MILTGLEADIRKIESRRGALLIRESASGSDYRNGGIMSDTGVEFDPIETSEDENGETRQLGVTVALNTRLMQTEATVALRLMREITSGRVDLILAARPVSDDVLTSTEAEEVGELIFAGRYLKVGATLRFDREQSFLPAQTEFRASMDALDSFAL